MVGAAPDAQQSGVAVQGRQQGGAFDKTEPPIGAAAGEPR